MALFASIARDPPVREIEAGVVPPPIFTLLIALPRREKSKLIVPPLLSRMYAVMELLVSSNPEVAMGPYGASTFQFPVAQYVLLAAPVQ